MNQDKILEICERKAKRGEMFSVHKYRYRDAEIRGECKRMAKHKKLKLHGQSADTFLYYRPEDLEIILKHERSHKYDMMKIHSKNVEWHLSQAKENRKRGGKWSSLVDYHLNEAEKERILAIGEGVYGTYFKV